MRKKRLATPINAGSMADIAFLLLIFFLVSTQILNDKGVKVLLPEYTENLPPPNNPGKKILKILINSNNELMINSERSDLILLKDQIKTFIMNPKLNPTFPPNPKKGVISITSDDETSYETYVQVYSEIKQAYIELWKQEALVMYGKGVDFLTREEVIKIKERIPMNLSELEKRL